MREARPEWLTVGMTSSAIATRIVRSAGVLALVLAAATVAAPAASAATTSSGAGTPASTAAASASTAAGTRIATVKPGKVVLTRTKAKSAIRMSWPKVAGATHYNLFIIGSPAEVATTTTRATSATISDMKAHVRYTVIVTPMKGSKAQTSMRAVMARALDGSGATATTATQTVAQAVASDAADATPETGSDKAPASIVEPANPGNDGTSSAPTAPSAPKTKTIYVCPDGFTDAGADCEKTMAYTFHTQTQTRAYTYTNKVIGTTSRQGTCDAVYEYWDGFSNNIGHYSYPCTITSDVYGDVKDETPAGFEDDGSAWVKHTQVKDATPSGYRDNGTAWVTTTAKVAKVVPA